MHQTCLPTKGVGMLMPLGNLLHPPQYEKEGSNDILIDNKLVKKLSEKLFVVESSGTVRCFLTKTTKRDEAKVKNRTRVKHNMGGWMLGNAAARK
jgi:hypothetical protein